ncbi:hypothetical protein [Marinobacterium sedimentorum]|uniref:hypothetical protein n=1 Tax=Marinobacterium sedimentorum TaxID=2927804 RepID=UPI0020C6FA38|nr:hypothetical protein [Marinobacterium sedimentorum]MCP8688771.1 hypothetical protein [Marinobacterium sedimentorum]
MLTFLRGKGGVHIGLRPMMKHPCFMDSPAGLIATDEFSTKSKSAGNKRSDRAEQAP